jgi:hypothetical protein
MNEILAALAAPFDPDEIDWRAGSTNADKTKCMALAYIDARTVMDRLDAVCGPLHWQSRYVPMPNNTTCCEIGINLDGEWVWKANGAGATDYEAEKGAYSDAFKRAAVLWGVGRYLYGLKSPWVACEQKGKSVIIDRSELPKLRAVLGNLDAGSSPPVATLPKKDARAVYSDLSLGLKSAGSLEALGIFWRKNGARIKTLPADWRKNLEQEKDDLKALFAGREAA